MNRIVIAVRLFFRALAGAEFAAQAERLLGGALPVPPPTAKPVAEPKPAAASATPARPARSEALTLLAVLQQEARLVDFLMEPIQGYDDAQVGAAVRGIHRDCGGVLTRLFDLNPLRAEPEGTVLDVPTGFDPAACKLTGDVKGTAPYRGTLRHPGWAAAKCEMPVWAGRAESALVVAPAEVEVR